MPTELDAAQILALLDVLVERCERNGIALDVMLVGGAALLLHGLNRNTTHDVDTRIGGDLRVLAVAREMAGEFNLPTDWFNSNASAWVPPLQGDETDLHPGVRLAGEPTLLAMKMVAARVKLS